MIKSRSRNLIVVLGMHRSGTSALAGMLSSFDLDLGSSLIRPSAHNPKGYFENTRVVAASDELLKTMEVSWADAYRIPFDLPDLYRIPDPVQQEILQMLSMEFVSDTTVLIKDPRMCTLLPVWKRIFKEMGWKTHYLIIWRDPAEVAESLKTRDMIPHSRSGKLWLYYNLCAELYTRGEDRCFISFSEMLDSPGMVLTRIRSFLPFLITTGTRTDNSVTGFVDQKLAHHHENGPMPVMHPLVQKLLSSLQGLAISKPGRFEMEIDGIRTEAEAGQLFQAPQPEQHEAVLQMILDDGSMKTGQFPVGIGPVHIEMPVGPGAAVKKIIFHPCNDHCIVKIRSFRLILSNGGFYPQEKFAGNSTMQFSGFFFFRNPLPKLFFHVPDGIHIDRAVVEASYQELGAWVQEKVPGKPTASLHILYFLHSFPTVSEVFILNEITAMIRKGVKVSIAAFQENREIDVLHKDIVKFDLMRRVRYLKVSTTQTSRKKRIEKTIYGFRKLFFGTTLSSARKFRLGLYSLGSSQKRLFLTHFTDIVNLVHAEKPDVIYCHFANHAGQIIYLRKLMNIPFITFFHGYDFSKSMTRLSRLFNYRELFKWGDLFLTNSTFSSKKIIELGCPAEHLSVPGLTVDDRNYPYIERSWRDGIRILTVGRLVEKKGMIYSIRAVAQCMKEFPGLQYDIIGEGPLRQELENLIAALGCKEKIRIMGNFSKEKVIRALLESDIFMLTSITAEDGETEGLGMVLLEAQLTGMPVLATRHNGFTDAVRDGISGFLVPEKDVDAAVERLSWLLHHPETWAGMGKAGRQHVLENYSEEVYMDKILRLIEQTMA